MQHHLTTSGAPHLGDALTACDAITLHYQHIVIMSICANKAAAVLDDDKLPVSPKSTTAVHHMPVRGSVYRLTEPAADIDALLLAIIVAVDDIARGGPSPAKHPVALGRRYRAIVRFRDRQATLDSNIVIARQAGYCPPRHTRLRFVGALPGTGNQSQALARKDGIGRTDTIPCCDLPIVEAVTPGDGVERLALAYNMVAGGVRAVFRHLPNGRLNTGAAASTQARARQQKDYRTYVRKGFLHGPFTPCLLP